MNAKKYDLALDAEGEDQKRVNKVRRYTRRPGHSGYIARMTAARRAVDFLDELHQFFERLSPIRPPLALSKSFCAPASAIGLVVPGLPLGLNDSHLKTFSGIFTSCVGTNTTRSVWRSKMVPKGRLKHRELCRQGFEARSIRMWMALKSRD